MPGSTGKNGGMTFSLLVLSNSKPARFPHSVLEAPGARLGYNAGLGLGTMRAWVQCGLGLGYNAVIQVLIQTLV